MNIASAIYENRVFRSEEPVDLAPGTRVQVSMPDDDDPVAIMKARFPDSFGGVSDEEAADMMRDIEESFGKVDPDEWK